MKASRVPPPTANDSRTSKIERLERTTIVLIVLVVGVLAGRASFSHVVDWSMRNLPDGTPRSYGYTNAAVSELLPVGALLFIRFQRRHERRPGALPWSMLVGAGLFSVTAQLAVAVPSPSGWLVAAVPTLAFMALTKLLLSMKPVAALQHPSDQPATHFVHATGNAPYQDGKGIRSQAGPRDDNARTANTPTTRRAMPKSLTSAYKVQAATASLGSTATAAQIAAKAGVSESTARRHMAPS